ncbi:MAG: tRNA preQ1(34) S-adenosylmethionine ribosyltransferase-isomerase QueA [Pirellulaceae bacterium]|jgi:S-adenosylmethionine:tRNA ribosyltransferase-isomerase|nr:tRNA preQ1(34) S-adenosylmethionine ribosyltransferase-isomerase QueA [Pirellulaceae bacterium]
MSELDHYDYQLPEELIAQHPLSRRSDARLMLVDRSRQQIDHYHIRDLPELLTLQDALVLNDTRVLPARLTGFRTRTGGRWFGLFLAEERRTPPAEGGLFRAEQRCRPPAEGVLQDDRFEPTHASTAIWKVMSKTRGKLHCGEEVTLVDHLGRPANQLKMLVDLGGGIWAAQPDPSGSPAEILEKIGRVPLPPYIRGGEMVEADVEQYQTVFAAKPGAVAAPTAGLHFTTGLLEKLSAKGVSSHHVTLHVGLGTFRPISASRLDEHAMHTEWGQIDATTVDSLNAHRAAGGRTIAIGTTAVRVLETAAASGTLAAWTGQTDLFIRPPYSFRAVDALMTNFHIPRSTLLVLVRTFGGDALMRRAYEEAIAEAYRFYSYGDTMLIV